MILSSAAISRNAKSSKAHNAQGSEQGSRRILRLSDHTLTASDPLLHSVVVVCVVVVPAAATLDTCKFVLILSM